VVKRIYRIREKRVKGATAYFVTLPSDVARAWLKISSYVVIERDPSDPFVLHVRLVKAEEVSAHAR
jgi:multisubunit Na+/H+ antiporter MnhE subunit